MDAGLALWSNLPKDRPVMSRRGNVVAWAVGFLVLGLVASVSAEPDALFGPAPRDSEGLFTNTDGDLPHGSASIRLPFFWRRITGSFRDRPGAPVRVGNDGAFLRENAKHSEPTVTWVGHATLLVQMDHVTFLTDPPVSSDCPPAPPAAPEDDLSRAPPSHDRCRVDARSHRSIIARASLQTRASSAARRASAAQKKYAPWYASPNACSREVPLGTYS